MMTAKNIAMCCFCWNSAFLILSEMFHLQVKKDRKSSSEDFNRPLKPHPDPCIQPDRVIIIVGF